MGVREHDPDRSIEPARLAAALTRFHEALADFPGELPAFTDQVEEIGNVLSDPTLTPMLQAGDRRFLRTVQRTILSELGSFHFPRPAASRRTSSRRHVLRSDDGPIFVDFETACSGPKEWDFSALGSESPRFSRL
jgi:hypothetical protein